METTVLSLEARPAIPSELPVSRSVEVFREEDVGCKRPEFVHAVNVTEL